MSNDFRDEPQEVLETKEPMSEEEIIQTLVNEFDSMFTREKLEANSYLVFKMSQSLELPVTAIYKDKKISSICTNLALIREALSRSHNVVYNREKEIITPKIKAMKNKLVLNKIPPLEKDKIFKVIYQSPEYIQKVSDKYIDNLKSYILILRTEEQAESLMQKVQAILHKDTTLDMHLETENLYLDLLQKAQEAARSQPFTPENQAANPYAAFYQNYGYYYGVNPFMNPYMGMGGRGGFGYRGGYNSQYYSSYTNQMFIRKAQDEAFEPENEREEENYGYHGKKKDRFTKQQAYNPKQRSEAKNNKLQMSPEEITKRTRVNSENFPPLGSSEKVQPESEKEQEPEPKQKSPEAIKPMQTGMLKYNKDEIIKLFKQRESQIKPNQNLSKFNENDVPVLNLTAKPTLEFIEPTPIHSYGHSHNHGYNHSHGYTNDHPHDHGHGHDHSHNHPHHNDQGHGHGYGHGQAHYKNIGYVPKTGSNEM